MGLISEEVEIGLSSHTICYYEKLGYEIPRYYNKNNKKMMVRKGTKIKVNVKDLPDNSCVLVDIECDGCGKKLTNIVWQAYKKCVHEDGKYYCKKCASNLFGKTKMIETRLKKSISFEQWCIENNKLNELNRWDYELNNYKPNEVGYSSGKYYFKCNNNVHPSEIKNISSFTSKVNGTNQIDCKACNSFAQWGIDNICDDFLDKYWDYDKNTVDPWEVSFGSSANKIWIKCLEGHESYFVTCNNFSCNNSRCPECNESKGEKQLDIILSKYNIPHDSQYTFDDLKGVGGGLLKFDVPVFWDKEKTQLRMLIEYDGKQHYEWVKGMMTKKKFETLQYHDKLKNQYCEKNNIILLRIPYWDFDNIEFILQNELSLLNLFNPINLSEVVNI